MIQASHLKKAYKVGALDLEVIKDFSLEIKQGEFISLVGPSGSGKSTVLNMLGCLDIEYPLIMIQNLPQNERKERINKLLKAVEMMEHKLHQGLAKKRKVKLIDGFLDNYNKK